MNRPINKFLRLQKIKDGGRILRDYLILNVCVRYFISDEPSNYLEKIEDKESIHEIRTTMESINSQTSINFGGKKG